MDQNTKLEAIRTLAKAAAEIAADVAQLTSDAAVADRSAATRSGKLDQHPIASANMIVGGIMPAEQHLEELQAIFRAMHVLHLARVAS